MKYNKIPIYSHKITEKSHKIPNPVYPWTPLDKTSEISSEEKKTATTTSSRQVEKFDRILCGRLMNNT